MLAHQQKTNFSHLFALMPQAKPQTHDLVDRLMLQTDLEHPNELELRRIEQELQKLKHHHDRDVAAEAYLLIGAIHLLHGRDKEGMNMCDQALRISPIRELRSNYSGFLSRRFYFAKAFELADDLVSKYPDDLEIIEAGCELAVMTLQLDRLDDYTEILQRLKSEIKTRAPKNQEFWKIFRSRFQERTGSLRTVLELIEVAGSVARKNHRIHQATSIDITEDGEVVILYCVDASPESAAETNAQIADAIVSQFDDPMVDLISIGCMTH
tara:strand:- start:282 stop:1085 length:804 start_codon:yes stop_codon:yes gene_type:complete